MALHSSNRLVRYMVAVEVIDIFGNNSMTLVLMNAEGKRCHDTENEMNRKEVSFTTKLAESRGKAEKLAYVH